MDTKCPTAPAMPGNTQPSYSGIPSDPPPAYGAVMGSSHRVSACEPQKTIKQRCTDYFYEYDLLKGTTLNKRKIAIAAVIGILVGLVVIGVVGGVLAATGGVPLVIGLGTLGAAVFSATVLGAFFGAVTSPCSKQHAKQVLHPATDAEVSELRDRAMAQCQDNCERVRQCRTENQAIDARRATLEQQAYDEELRNRPVRERNQQLRAGLHLANGVVSMAANTHAHYSGHCRRHHYGHCRSHYPGLTNHLMIDVALPDPATPYADQLRADDRVRLRNRNIEQKHHNEMVRLCELYKLHLEEAHGLNPRVSKRTDVPVNAGDLPA